MLSHWIAKCLLLIFILADLNICVVVYNDSMQHVTIRLYNKSLSIDILYFGFVAVSVKPLLQITKENIISEWKRFV